MLQENCLYSHSLCQNSNPESRTESANGYMGIFSSCCLDFTAMTDRVLVCFLLLWYTPWAKIPLGRKGLPYIFKQQSTIEGSRGRNREQKPRRKLPIGLLSDLVLSRLFMETRTTGQEMALPIVGWALLHHQRNAPQMCSQANLRWANCSAEGPASTSQVTLLCTELKAKTNQQRLYLGLKINISPYAGFCQGIYQNRNETRKIRAKFSTPM